MAAGRRRTGAFGAIFLDPLSKESKISVFSMDLSGFTYLLRSYRRKTSSAKRFLRIVNLTNSKARGSAERDPKTDVHARVMHRRRNYLSPVPLLYEPQPARETPQRTCFVLLPPSQPHHRIQCPSPDGISHLNLLEHI